jgi:hypothetical protein
VVALHWADNVASGHVTLLSNNNFFHHFRFHLHFHFQSLYYS